MKNLFTKALFAWFIVSLVGIGVFSFYSVPDHKPNEIQADDTILRFNMRFESASLTHPLTILGDGTIKIEDRLTLKESKILLRELARAYYHLRMEGQP